MGNFVLTGFSCHQLWSPQQPWALHPSYWTFWSFWAQGIPLINHLLKSCEFSWYRDIFLNKFYCRHCRVLRSTLLKKMTSRSSGTLSSTTVPRLTRCRWMYLILFRRLSCLRFLWDGILCFQWEVSEWASSVQSLCHIISLSYDVSLKYLSLFDVSLEFSWALLNT